MSSRSERRDATRAKLVETARSQFRQFGYNGTGIRDIAKGVGMSTGAVFAHFDGKDALWEAAMGSSAPSVLYTKAAMEAAIKPALAAVDHETPRAALLEISLQLNRLVRGLYGEGAA